jgi:hypothetical protein
MVLVDTRNNGRLDMILPSLEFNHCIVKASLDGKEYYIELTDNHLPFASLPNNLMYALKLEIPMKSEVFVSDLKPLVSLTKTKDIARTHITVTPEGSDLNVQVTATKHGNLSSYVRSDFSNLDYQDQFKVLEEKCAGNYKNLVMDTLSIEGLTELNDSITMRYGFRIKDEIAEIGKMQTFKLPFVDVVATLSKFAAPPRIYPVAYNDYEDTDLYETEIEILVPNGKRLVEIPASESFSFGKLNYSLRYSLTTSGNLKVVRTFTTDRNEIPASEYSNFRAFVEKIVKAEQKMIALQ